MLLPHMHAQHCSSCGLVADALGWAGGQRPRPACGRMYGGAGLKPACHTSCLLRAGGLHCWGVQAGMRSRLRHLHARGPSLPFMRLAGCHGHYHLAMLHVAVQPEFRRSAPVRSVQEMPPPQLTLSRI